jgi:hypothetical protein
MADSFTSELAQRLLRRATRPVGVVDVRPAQARYERAIAWPRQHVTMLDRAAARQQTDAQPGQDQRLLLAARPLEATGSLGDMIPGNAVMDALRSSPNAPAFSPASLARIAARQQSSGAPESAPAPRAAATSASREAGPARGETGKMIVGPAMRAVTRSSADLPLPSRGAARADHDRSRDQSSIPGAGDGTVATNAVMPMPSPIAAAEPAPAIASRAIAVHAAEPRPATIDAPHVFVQRGRAANRDSGFGIRDSAGADQDSGVRARASALRVRDSGLGIRDSRVAVSNVTSPANPTNPTNPESQIPNPVDVPPPAVDRDATLSLRSTSRSVQPVRQPDEASVPAARTAPTATGARASVDAAPLQLVWRRGSPHDAAAAASASGTSTHAGAGTSVVAATGSPAAASFSTATAATDAAAATAAPGGGMRDGDGIDLDQILEEIVRRITEMQIVERERQGDPWL